MNTDYNKINSLINSYFNGETSRLEEEILRHYFLYEDVVPELLPYKSLFVSMNQLTDISDFLEEEMLDFEDSKFAYNAPFNPQKNRHTTYFFKIGIAITGIAASLILLFMLFKPNNHSNYVVINGIKYTDGTIVENALDASVENIRFDFEEIFSDLDDLDLDDFKYSINE